MPEHAKVFLSLGSNIAPRESYLRAALQGLSENGTLQKVSSLWETPAWGYNDPKAYLNVVCEFHTHLKPEALLSLVETIEVEVGRKKKTFADAQYAEREVDIDILFYNRDVVVTEFLCIPHPHLELRNFVLLPMNEIAPHFEHPSSGITINELLKRSPDTSHAKLLPWNINS